MTDVAAPAVATAEAPVVEAQVPTGDSPDAVRRSARQQVRDMGQQVDSVRQKAQESRQRAHDQPRTESGKFTTEATDEAAAAAEPVTPPEAGDSVPGEPSAEAAEDQPLEAGKVRIELPEGHPLRDQGRTFYDVPEMEERQWREAINGAARRKEVDEARTALQQREKELAEMRRQALLRDAEARFQQEKGSEFWTADHQQKYQDILDTYGPEDAEAYKAGQVRKRDEAMAEVRDQADEQAVQQTWQREGTKFKTEAMQTLPSMFPGVTPQEIDTAVKMYAAELSTVESAMWQRAQGHMTKPQFARWFLENVGYSGDDFMTVAGGYLQSRPGVVQRQGHNQTAEALRRKQIEAELAEQKREELKAASQRHAQNPQRALGAVASPARSTSTEEPELDLKEMSPGAIKKAMRSATRELGMAVGAMRRR